MSTVRQPDRLLPTTATWLFLLAPLAVIPGGFDQFVFGKLAVCAVAVVVASLTARRGVVPKSVTWALLACAGLFVFSALVGQTPVASLVGRWPRYDGVAVLAVYLATLWAGARLRLRDAVFARAASVVGAALGLLSVLEVIGWSPLGLPSQARAGTVLGNATDQGVLGMMLFLILLTSPISDKITRWVGLAGGVGALVTVAASASRTAIVLTLLASVVALLWQGIGSRRRLAWVGTGLSVFVLLVLVFPETRHRLLSGDTIQGRLLQWKLTSPLVKDHLLGIGPSRYVDAFGPAETMQWHRFTGPIKVIDSPHNIVLQVLLAGGVPLLIAAGVAVVFAVRRILATAADEPAMRGSALAVMAFGLAMLANFPTAPITSLAGLLIGALISVPADPQPFSLRERLVTAGAGALVVLMLMGCIADQALGDAQRAATNGEISRTKSSLRLAAAMRPFDGDTHMIGAQLFAMLASGGLAAAIQPTATEAVASLKRTPQTYQSLVALGVSRLAARDPQGAAVVLSKAIRQFPMRSMAYLQRSIANAQLGNLGRARRDVRSSIRLAPHFEPALEWRKQLYLVR